MRRAWGGYAGPPMDPASESDPEPAATSTPLLWGDVSHDDTESEPSTAEIIANQSQDYVDEKLAEYQATIHYLAGEFFAK